MRAKSTARLKAEKLRREQGLSYKEISALTEVNKSTLSGWLRDIPLKPEHIARLQDRLEANRASFAARAAPINYQRHWQARQLAYQAGAAVIGALPRKVCVAELALAMLYLGEGSKNNRRVQIANTDPAILSYVLSTLRKLYAIEEARISLRLNLVEAARPLESQMIVWWCQQLSVETRFFQKSQFDPRSHGRPLTGAYHGVCTVNYNDSLLQQRILGIANTYITEHRRIKEK